MRLSRETNVLVTGASSGIGAATALAFARRGAGVALVARRAEALAGVAAACLRRGARAAEAVPLDLSVPGAGVRAVAEALRRLGTLDVLVVNAGYGNAGPVAGYPPEKMARLWQVNYQSGYESIHAALPHMTARRRGHIFIVASVVGRRAMPYAGPYCATKFAQVALGEALFFELLGTGVLSTVICPGSTDTAFFEALEDDGSGLSAPRRRGRQPPDVVAEGIARAVGKPRREIRFTLTGKAALLANRLAPWLLDRAVAWRVRTLARRRAGP